MGRLDGKVAVITGAARGQGAAEARLFVAEGARVVLGDVLDDAGEALARELGAAAWYVHLDVAQPGDWAGAVGTATDRYGDVNVLVNNAGVLRVTPIATATVDEYMAVVAVNQVGTFLGMQAVSASMARAGGGSIVNVSSVDGFVGHSGLSAYVASKFAVRGMTKAAAVELGPAGIRVNSVHPGGVDTPMLDDIGVPEGAAARDARLAHLPIGRCGRPEEVARLVLFLAADESSYCTGSEFVVDGGMLATTGDNRR